GFEVPLQAASMTRRVVAVATDALLVIVAFTAFAYIFLKVTPAVPPLTQAAGISAVLLGLFWLGYQYLLLVHAGSTPDRKLARLVRSHNPEVYTHLSILQMRRSFIGAFNMSNVGPDRTRYSHGYGTDASPGLKNHLSDESRL